MALGFYAVIAVDNASVSHVVAMSVSQAIRRHIQSHLAPLGRQDDVDAPASEIEILDMRVDVWAWLDVFLHEVPNYHVQVE